MKIIIPVIALLISYSLTAQDSLLKINKNNYSIKESSFNNFKNLLDEKYLAVTIVNKKIELRTPNGVLLGNFVFDPVASNEPATKKFTSTSDRTINVNNRNYISKSKIIVTDGRIEKLLLSIDNVPILTIDATRGWHCINPAHDPKEKCDRSPSIVSPPCGKPDCIWQQD